MGTVEATAGFGNVVSSGLLARRDHADQSVAPHKRAVHTSAVTVSSPLLNALEGERGPVTRLYARISADVRHTDLELIHCESITRRRYGEWSMARVHLSDVDPQTKIVWPDFDPYSASGALVMARIDELIAQGKLVHAPVS
jgi:Sensors of blue-light using FAD